jgi:transposase
MKYRTFSNSFKEELVEAIMSGVSATKLSRQHCIARSRLYYWLQQYKEGKLGFNGRYVSHNPQARIKELERIVGRLTADNALLKKALQQPNCPTNKNEILSAPIEIPLEVSKGGAGC